MLGMNPATMDNAQVCKTVAAGQTHLCPGEFTLSRQDAKSMSWALIDLFCFEPWAVKGVSRIR